jgi:hypothetical protein
VKQTSIVSTVLAAFLVGCASASYKPRNAGITHFGYDQIKISENEYALEYYGAKSDPYEKLEEFWHRRAEEVCKSKNYQADFSRGTYEGKTLLLLPPFIYYDKEDWPLIKGKLRCVTD